MKFNEFIINEAKLNDLDTDAIVVYNTKKYQRTLEEAGIIDKHLRFKGYIESRGEHIYIAEEYSVKKKNDIMSVQDLRTNKTYNLLGPKKELASIFKYKVSRKGATSTPVKELIPMWVFEKFQNGGSYSEEAILKMADQVPEVQIAYQRKYYKIAVDSLKYYKNLKLKGKYYFERPDAYSNNESVNDVYRKASSLGIGKADNWNPGDIWFFNNDGRKAVKEMMQIDNLPDFNTQLNYQVHQKNIIPMSLKAPDKGPSKLYISDPSVKSKEKPFDIKDYKFDRINVSMKPTHISYMAIKSKGGIEIYMQAQTPSGAKGPVNKKTGELNPNYKAELNPTIVLRSAGKNHAFGSVITQKDWQQSMMDANKKRLPLYRKTAIGSLTQSPPTEVTEAQFNYYRKFYMKYKPNKNASLKFEDFMPQARIQYVIFGSWMEFITENYDEVFTSTYLMAKKAAGGLDVNSYTAHWIIA